MYLGMLVSVSQKIAPPVHKEIRSASVHLRDGFQRRIKALPKRLLCSGTMHNKYIDGSFHMASGTKSSRAILRNSGGELICAEAHWCEDLTDTLTSEALAIRGGMMIARRLGAQTLLLESDNLSIVKMMSTSDGARSVIAMQAYVMMSKS